MATDVPFPERTSGWPHYDAAAIAVAAALAVSRPNAPSTVAKAAYDFADALAKEALRRRLADPIDLYAQPIRWIKEECSPEKLRGQQISQEILGKQFLWRFLNEGQHVAETYQETIEAIEALRPDQAATLANSAAASVVNQMRDTAITLLKAQI